MTPSPANHTTNPTDRPYEYTVYVQGQLSQGWLAYLSGEQVHVQVNEKADGFTLTGTFQDQAALIGILQMLYNLGCVLVAVERLDQPLRI